jgi:hypothetical protein
VSLTGFRDLRDNFAVKIWNQPGYPNVAGILPAAEIPIALAVFGKVALMIYRGNNERAFLPTCSPIMLSVAMPVVTTWCFQQQCVAPAVWMISVGFALYRPTSAIIPCFLSSGLRYFATRGQHRFFNVCGRFFWAPGQFGDSFG